jgi:hypothetical protein
MTMSRASRFTLLLALSFELAYVIDYLAAQVSHDDLSKMLRSAIWSRLRASTVPC